MGVFTNVIRKFLHTDRAHADLFNEVNEKLIGNDLYLKEQIEKTNHSIKLVLTSAGWSSSAPFVQEVQVAGVTATDIVVGSPLIPKGASASQKKSADCIDGFVTDNGKIVFHCNKKRPSENVTVMIKGV